LFVSTNPDYVTTTYLAVIPIVGRFFLICWQVKSFSQKLKISFSFVFFIIFVFPFSIFVVVGIFRSQNFIRIEIWVWYSGWFWGSGGFWFQCRIRSFDSVLEFTVDDVAVGVEVLQAAARRVQQGLVESSLIKNHFTGKQSWLVSFIHKNVLI